MKFNIKDINGKELWAKVKAEAHEIYHNPNKKNDDRTLAEIQNTNFYGLAPEQFLIENCGFHNDPRKYKDVISPEGHAVEIKTTTARGVRGMLNKCDHWKEYEHYRKMPEWVFVFECEASWNRISSTHNVIVDSGPQYELQGTYQWNGQSYVDKAFPWKSEANTAISMHEDELWLANPVWAVKHNA